MQLSTSGVAIQSWTLYALGACLIVSRIIFRCTRLRSIFKLQADDWLMILVLIPFTGSVICASQISNLPSVPDVEDITWVLKMRFALEECQITTIWLVKACLLILYWRSPVTTCRKGRRYLAWLSAYCFFSYLAIHVLMISWCYPVRDYWNPVSGNSQCSTYRNYSITTLTFNLTTLILLILPMPFIRTPHICLLAILIGLGVIIMIAAILGRYYIIAHPTTSTFLYWYPVETVAILLFANFPFLSSLVTSTTPSRIRNISSNHTVSQWPRSYKDTPPLPAERLNCTATTISTTSSVVATESWSDTFGIPSTPPEVPVKTLRLTDPMPELEGYLSTMRPLIKEEIV